MDETFQQNAIEAVQQLFPALTGKAGDENVFGVDSQENWADAVAETLWELKQNSAPEDHNLLAAIVSALPLRTDEIELEVVDGYSKLVVENIRLNEKADYSDEYYRILSRWGNAAGILTLYILTDGDPSYRIEDDMDEYQVHATRTFFVSLVDCLVLHNGFPPIAECEDGVLFSDRLWHKTWYIFLEGWYSTCGDTLHHKSLVRLLIAFASSDFPEEEQYKDGYLAEPTIFTDWTLVAALTQTCRPITRLSHHVLPALAQVVVTDILSTAFPSLADPTTFSLFQRILTAVILQTDGRPRVENNNTYALLKSLNPEPFETGQLVAAVWTDLNSVFQRSFPCSNESELPAKDVIEIHQVDSCCCISQIYTRLPAQLLAAQTEIVAKDILSTLHLSQIHPLSRCLDKLFSVF
ncbi:hypothetical protein BDR26DRAFT_448613 [Obelidium mucronatum]|nr:hypothetical protein BDR26DRAFT_448613 [Obelidium mucronatum]